MFHAPTIRIRTERVLSTVAFALVLATWIAGYAVLCPADPVPGRRVAVLQVRL